MVRHCITLAVKEAETRGERGREGRHQAALFYADDGMIALSDPQWLQWAFTKLVRLFERVGLNTNIKKTVSMTCRPCTAAGNRLEEAYGLIMTGEGLTFWERKRERVKCGNFRKEVADGSLDSHHMSQHGKARERRWTCTDAATGGGEGGEPQTYRIEFPKGGAGAGGQASDRPLLRRLWHDSVVRTPMATVGVYAASRTV